ncbi:TPA: cytochrome b [Neisseria gonorrhoeae]
MNTNQPAVYDPLTRALHWLTVAGFIGILTTIVLWTIYEEAEWAGSLFGLHKSFGFLMLTVIALRIVWAVANRAKRPQSDSKAAAAGHGILYLLMLAVPVIGMIRQYGGGGRGPLKVFGVEVMQGSPEKIEWMANLGNTFHGNLGWLLFAAVVGHVAMVVVHRVQGKDVLYRMTGRVR